MDREKVIGHLNDCMEASRRDNTWVFVRKDIVEDVLAMLKEQEAELSYRDAKKITNTATRLDDATCPSCGNVVGEKQIWGERKIFIQWKYCIFCGQKLDWEGR